MQQLGQTDRPVNRQLYTAVTVTALIILLPVRTDARRNSQLCMVVIIIIILRPVRTDAQGNSQPCTAVIIIMIIFRPVQTDARGNSQPCTAVMITALLRHPYWLSIDGSTAHVQVPYSTVQIQLFIRHIGKQRYNSLPIR